jgi:hypothetical protein
MIDYVCGTGGYYDQGHFAIEYLVPCYRADLDFNTLWTRHEQEQFAPAEIGLYKSFAMRYFDNYTDQNKLWEWGIEGAQESVRNDDANRMIWNEELPYRVKFQFHGRGGKHLCPVEFGHYDLRVRPEYLAEQMLEWPMKDVRALYKLCRQWDVDFTPEKASSEVEYQAAWTLFHNYIENDWDVFLDEQKAEVAQAVAELRASWVDPEKWI